MLIKCQRCGKMAESKSPLKKYCDLCRYDLHNKKKREWYQQHREQELEKAKQKRSEPRYCCHCGKRIKPKTWDEVYCYECKQAKESKTWFDTPEEKNVRLNSKARLAKKMGVSYGQLSLWMEER